MFRKKTALLARLAAVLCLIAICAAEAQSAPRSQRADSKRSYDKRARIFPGKTWEQAKSPESAGWSSEKLTQAKEYAKSIGTMSWLLVEDGVVIDRFGPIDKLNSLHSARKSLMSAMYGMAVKDGTIKLSSTLADLNVDDNEPKLTNEEKQATLRDLLMARSGVYHPALGEAPAMKAARPERGSHPHGTFWYYNNWDFNALGTVFNRLTNASLFAFFADRIAKPLQMEDYKVADQEYGDGEESTHKYYNFRMSARDLARFGLLFLRGGEWHGKQIVAKEWVLESTTPYSDTVGKFLPHGMGYYGYLWWIGHNGNFLPKAELPDGSFAALGVGPQVILVVPSKNIVFVHRVATEADAPLVPMDKVGGLIKMVIDAKQAPTKR